MTGLTEFVTNNIWLCIVIGVIAVIVLDEVLGITRGIFGDNMDNAPATPQARARDEMAEAVDPIEALQREADDAEITVDDLLTPPRRK
jgi:hypothetical protein